MKADIKILSNLRENFNAHFKTGEMPFRSFHDVLWQIAINGMLDDEKEPVIFSVNVMGEHGNELVLAFASGGFKGTGVYFVNDNYNKCSDIAEEITSLFFQIDKEEQMKCMSRSMAFSS